MTDHTDDTVEVHVAALQKLKADIPYYEGEGAKPRHYQWLHNALDAGITALRTDRDGVVEECAKVADEAVSETKRWKSPGFWMAQSLAERIRSLKGDNHVE